MNCEYVFVVVSPQLGPHFHALSYVSEIDLDHALKVVSSRLLVGMVIVSYAKISSKQTGCWEFFKAFVREPGGTFLGGLKFRQGDFLDIGCSIGVDGEEFFLAERHILKMYTVIVGHKSIGRECSACFDWYAPTIDEVRRSVEKFLPRGVEVCGVYEGCCSGVNPFWEMLAVEGRWNFIEFRCMRPEEMMKNMYDALLFYHGTDVASLKSLEFRKVAAEDVDP